MNTVITIDEDESVDVSTKITIDDLTKPKQRQKSSKDKNVDRILTKVKRKLMDYADRISKKLTRNHNYIKKELVSNPYFEKPLKIRAILA